MYLILSGSSCHVNNINVENETESEEKLVSVTSYVFLYAFVHVFCGVFFSFFYG